MDFISRAEVSNFRFCGRARKLPKLCSVLVLFGSQFRFDCIGSQPCRCAFLTAIEKTEGWVFESAL